MREVLIIDAVRSPVGRYGGALATVRPDDLLAAVLKALVDRTGIDPNLLEDVYAGCCNQAGEDNRDVARMSVLLAGLPLKVGGVTVNRNCSSGLEAINQAAKAIIAGEGDVFIGGGVESMSRAPWSIPKPHLKTLGHQQIYDTTIGWRYPNPAMDAMYPIVSLGETAENIAEEMRITREEQDAFALESQRRAVKAINSGLFQDEIIPIEVPGRKGDSIMVSVDEHPRYYRGEEGKYVLATSMEKLAKLPPVFRKGGTVTAGNSSGINDGAAAVLLMSKDRAEEQGMKPMARWVGSAVAGVDPGVMGYGPVPSTDKLLKRLNLSIVDIKLIELNEAFAAQAIGVMQKAGFREEITNVNGGAIALGHPIGCSGARILTTLLHEMKRRADKRASEKKSPYYGLATLCVGVGQGVSTIVEWIDE